MENRMQRWKGMFPGISKPAPPTCNQDSLKQDWATLSKL